MFILARNHAQKWLQQGLELLFPPRCAGCQRSGHLLCPGCLQSMQPFTQPICQHCGMPLATSGEQCFSCQQHHLRIHGLRCVNFYQGPLRLAIHAFKYSGQRRLAEPLGLLLAEAFTRYDMHADIILPLPLHTQRQQERGYNQASLLAKVCATHLKVPYLEERITRQRFTRPQVGLNRQERQENVAGAFTLTPGWPKETLAGCRVLLIDDVCTTGATLEACASALRAGGVSEIWGLVLSKPGRLIQDASKLML